MLLVLLLVSGVIVQGIVRKGWPEEGSAVVVVVAMIALFVAVRGIG
jgi:hypothetical protein